MRRMESGSSTTDVLQRLREAINRHDLDALAACFEPDYHSEFPAHPDRTFRGHEQMRKNWSQIFGAVPEKTCGPGSMAYRKASEEPLSERCELRGAL